MKERLAVAAEHVGERALEVGPGRYTAFRAHLGSAHSAGYLPAPRGSDSEPSVLYPHQRIPRPREVIKVKDTEEYLADFRAIWKILGEEFT